MLKSTLFRAKTLKESKFCIVKIECFNKMVQDGGSIRFYATWSPIAHSMSKILLLDDLGKRHDVNPIDMFGS